MTGIYNAFSPVSPMVHVRVVKVDIFSKYEINKTKKKNLPNEEDQQHQLHTCILVIKEYPT